MNALPEHRRAIHARTHSQSFRHSDYAAVEHYPATLTPIASTVRTSPVAVPFVTPPSLSPLARRRT